MYDLIIIGAGPAGITAAIYAARKQLKTLVISQDVGGQAAWSSDIENYTGFQFITGPELAKNFEEHLNKFKDVVELKKGAEVKCVSKDGDYFKVTTESGEEFSGKTVVVSTGRKPRLLGVPGEIEFKNKGVTYCATCDGPVFAGLNIAVVGGGNSALDAVLQMMNIAPKIYLVNITDALTGDPVMIEKVNESDKVEVLNKTKTIEIIGDKFASGMKVVGPDGERILDVKGVFVEIGSTPANIPSSCAGVVTDKWGEIIVNEKCETNVPGLFAAGDVTNVPEKQIIVAAGQGCIASISAFKYLSKNKI